MTGPVRVQRRRTRGAIEQRAREALEADAVRVVIVGGVTFLIIGFKRDTREDGGYWVNEKGQRQDFEYLEEHTIALGRTHKALSESLEEYIRISHMTMEEYLQEKLAANAPTAGDAAASKEGRRT